MPNVGCQRTVGLDGGQGGTEFAAAGRGNYVTVTFWPGQAVGRGVPPGRICPESSGECGRLNRKPVRQPGSAANRGVADNGAESDHRHVVADSYQLVLD